MEKRWITPKECAIYLSIHLKTVYAKISKGEIPSGKLGGLIRIDRKRLDQILEAGETDISSKIEGWGLL